MATDSAKLTFEAKSKLISSGAAEMQKAKHDHIQIIQEDNANMCTEHARLKERLHHEFEQLSYERVQALEDRNAKQAEDAANLVEHIFERAE